MPNDPDQSPPEIGYHHNRRANQTRATAQNRESIRAVPGRAQPAITHIRISHIETTIMTAAQYSDAVETLAVLVARYERMHPEEPAAA